MAKSPKAEINNLNLGGISNSLYQGLPNSVYRMVGLDVHSEPGLIKVNQKLTKESGSNIDSFVKKILPCSDGNTYMFGYTNGKIWQRTSAGVYSLVATAAPSLGSVGIMDAQEYQGYIYYSMQSKLGRWQIGTSWSTRNDSWAEFTNKDSVFHPMQIVNLVLYIGDGSLIAQVEDGIFVANALDINTPLRASALGMINLDVPSISIGTFVSDNVNLANVFRWNGWSVSYSSSDEFPEKGVNSFLKADNQYLASVGEKGHICTYNGSILSRYKRIPGDWTIGKKAKVHSDASADFYGLPLFGFSNVANNPCLQGIYSLGSYSAEYASILNLEYVISPGKVADIEIGSIAIVDDGFLVSWKDGTTYGVDKLDSSLKHENPYLESRQMIIDRDINSKALIRVYYKSLPANTDILFYANNNGAGYSTAIATTKDAAHKYIETTVKVSDLVTLQIKIAPVSSANVAPEIEGVAIIFD